MLQLAHPHSPARRNHLRMIEDDNDHRGTDTDVVPAMSEAEREQETSPYASEHPMRDTKPPDAEDFKADRVLRAMIPGAPKAPSLDQDTDDMRAMATDELVVMHKRLNLALDELLGPDGRLAKQTEAISAVVDRAADKWDGTYRLLAGQIQSLSERFEKKDREHDQRFETFERKQLEFRDSVARQMGDIRARLELVERSVEQGRVTDKQIGELKSLINTLVLKFDAIETTPMPRALKASSALSGRVVLVVEDLAALLRSQVRALESHGASVLPAKDFAEAKAAVGGASPDCVLLDLRLGAASGFDVAEWLIADQKVPPARILLLTGQADRRDREAAERLGLTVVEKPIGSAELVDAILLSLAKPTA